MRTNRMPDALNERLGPEAAAGLLLFFDHERALWKGEVIGIVSDRFERRLVEETSKLRVEMTHGFGALRQEIAEVRQEIGGLRHTRMADRFELLKWAFLFWVGQFFAMASLVAVLVRFLKPPA